MANEFTKINANCVNSCGDVDQQLIEKLFPKCRPKNKSNDCHNDINENYHDKRDEKELLIDLDFINDNNMDELKAKEPEVSLIDNAPNDSVKSNLAAIGFKLDQLLLSPEEEFKPLNHNFINKPSVDIKDDDEPTKDKDITLRESRIEIAGGREIFSASKSKPNKKRVNSNLLSHYNMNNEDRVAQSLTKSMRNNTTQTIINDNSISLIPESTSIASVTQMLQSPICDLLTDLSKSGEHKHKLSSGIVVYEDYNSKKDSEIIYDDIEEIDQKELKLSVKPIDSEPHNKGDYDSAYNDCANEQSVSDSTELNDQRRDSHEDHQGERGSDRQELDSVQSDDSQSQTNSLKSSPQNKPTMVDESKGIARVIGNVPIAQYDGSPRRYGPKPPGYPKRVINNEDLSVSLANSNGDTSGLGDISCDELVKSILSIPMPYDDCLTNASNGSKSHSSDIPSVPNSELESDKNDAMMETADSEMNVYQFSDLDYKLYRMNTVGNSYVGKRLATLSSANSEDERSVTMSPSKSVNESMIAHENELILLHERVRQHIFNEIVSNDRSPVSTCPEMEMETGPEAADRVIEANRHFTLSPDITDCDSNEIESELSLEGSLFSANKIIAMPVLEDGLSSGVPSSDNELEEDANTGSPIGHSYSKKQACDRLEEELVSKLRLKLKRNDSLGDTQIGYNNAFRNENCVSRNVSSNQTEYRNESSDCSHKMNCQSSAKESCVDHNGSHYGMDSNSCEHQPQESIWVHRNDPNVKPVDTNPDEINCEQSVPRHHEEDCDTDQETDRLLGAQRSDDRGFYDDKNGSKKSNATREVLDDPSVLIEGVLFRARYLGSTQLVCEGQPTKATRMMQAEEAVSRIKAPEGDTQPSTDVDLFISTEKIMVLNTDLKEIMMDHSLRTISYIADIGDLLVLMARRRILNAMDDTNENSIKRIPKMICHVFESEEAQFIAQSIGQAFQVAYMEFLKANGIEDSSFVKEMDYQEVLNSQEIFGNELEMFAKKERQKEVIVPKQKGEILGMVIVESGWGSMLPTVVIANMAQHGPSARCGQLNIGDQIIAINGVSLVGLPLSTCQNYIKNTKNQTVVKFTVVPCPPVVEVKIKRPDTKYQLGFSVQNGVICSLLRGGIAERGGVRVGHRIIEINGQSVVAVPHDRIVNLLATSVGEILMKTMPTSMFRLLTGQEMPAYM